MGFFQTFQSWLSGQLSSYIADNTARLATALEPAVVTFGTLYVVVWGYLHLTGRVEQPFVTGLKRIATLALVLGVGLRLWLYNDVIVDTFYNAPAQLAARVIGSGDPVSIVDSIWDQGGAVAWRIAVQDGVFSSFGLTVMAAIVWILVGLLCLYTMFLLSLSNIALAVLLALGPLFICTLLFERTRRFFDSWLAQLTNYALVTVLTVLTGALLLQIVQSYALQTEQRGSSFQAVDAIDMVLVSVLVFLVMRQILPIASGLAGGIALSTHGALSSGIRMTLRPLEKRFFR
jgi:type IV secretion system protein VirB6